MLNYVNTLPIEVRIEMLRELDEFDAKGFIGEGVLRKHAREYARRIGASEHEYNRAIHLTALGLCAARSLANLYVQEVQQ